MIGTGCNEVFVDDLLTGERVLCRVSISNGWPVGRVVERENRRRRRIYGDRSWNTWIFWVRTGWVRAQLAGSGIL